ncbi:NAD(P)/FAD-dependent oxidoreductase [Neglectibacter caecimuris]|uniref:NAD(P)/FAD-dependent oxidoreductase n=1 Tax=Neglectibacter caecimuris TaxID=3093658 RepID=UPI002AC8F2CC|nr:NAD(P)/FAD-dependent oxidoreductase [Neglectibacter sp. M00184]
MNRENSFDAIVAGGGPAGLMAAGIAAARGRRVALLEKNRQLGRKLRITGKGRCNVTNHCSVEEAVAAAPRGGKFLYGAFSAFPPEAVMSFFEDLGVPLKTERGRRVFPVSDKAEDIAEALERFILQAGVQVIREPVSAVLTEGGAVWGVRTPAGEYRASSVLLACGGASYPGTGSNGDGSRLAVALGHTVKPLVPSLVPLVEQGGYCPRLMGLSLRNCGLKVTERGKKKPVYEDFGELLFAHFGLSGPTVLSASAHMHPMEPGSYTVHIDLKPALDHQKLDARLLRDLEKNQNRMFLHSLEELLPQKLIPVVVERSGIPGETRCHSVTREQRRELAGLLKDFTIEIRGFRPLQEAIVTCGGVSLKEIDPRTMGSKLVSGLFFAGEIMDCDAYTGGYNLQIAFSTGHLAGSFL